MKIHRSRHRHLHFLRDAEYAHSIGPDDMLYLPVDAVIRRISREIPSAGLGDTFDSINSALRKAEYRSEDMLVWDDLWFWGFFSQDSSSKSRTLGWNAGRFWGQLSAPKGDIEVVRGKFEEFLRLFDDHADK